jgi:DNA polymerase-3 subunit epsilon
MILCYDTETSGLPIWKEPSDNPKQPFIVQLAMVMLDDVTLEETGAQCMILQPPPGRYIPEAITQIHGITTQRAFDEGIDRTAAMIAFADVRRRASVVVAHNEQFDRRMTRIDLLRSGFTKPQIEALEAIGTTVCTQRVCTPILNIPPTVKMVKAGFNKPKSASLADCLKYLFREEIADAHGALSDARNCGRVYKWCVENGHVGSRDLTVG